MLNLFKVLLVLFLIPAFGQDNEAVYSVYFDASTNPGTKKLNVVASQYFGTYGVIPKSESDLRGAAGHHLVLDETGIYFLKNRLLSISREEVRENSQYSINNGYLHGVIDNDSVLVALEDDSYYFLIPKKIFIYEIADENTKIYQGLIPNELLLLSQENNSHYSAIYITIKGGEVILKELDFDQKKLDFRTLKGQKTSLENVTTYILNPTKTEWKNLMNYFVEYDRYKIINAED